MSKKFPVCIDLASCINRVFARRRFTKSGRQFISQAPRPTSYRSIRMLSYRKEFPPSGVSPAQPAASPGPSRAISGPQGCARPQHRHPQAAFQERSARSESSRLLRDRPERPCPAPRSSSGHGPNPALPGRTSRDIEHGFPSPAPRHPFCQKKKRGILNVGILTADRQGEFMTATRCESPRRLQDPANRGRGC